MTHSYYEIKNARVNLFLEFFCTSLLEPSTDIYCGHFKNSSSFTNCACVAHSKPPLNILVSCRYTSLHVRKIMYLGTDSLTVEVFVPVLRVLLLDYSTVVWTMLRRWPGLQKF
jgi:hypothetical protein